MDQIIKNPDTVMTKQASGEYGQVYLGDQFGGRRVQIAVSTVDDDPADDWQLVVDQLATADPGEIPDDVLDSLVGTLAAVNHDGRETTDSEWSDVATALTSTPADELPDQVVSAMNAKLTQLDMEARDD